MKYIRNINNKNEITLNNNWVPATKFNSINRLIDEKGNRISSDYKGRQYRIIEKRERTFSRLERFGRGFLGTLAVVCTLCLALFSKSVKSLFTKSKENVRFAILETSSPSISRPSNSSSDQRTHNKSSNQSSNSSLDQSTHNKSSGARISEPTEEAKNIAATKIQIAYRRHIACLTLKKLRNEQQLRKREEASIIIQSACRTYLAHSKLKTLQKEIERKKLEDSLKALESTRIEESIPKFSAHTAKVYFTNVPKKFLISNENDVESMVKEINDKIYQTHKSISVYFKGLFISDKYRKEKLECYQRAFSATNLQFIMPVNSSFLWVKAKPIAIEELGNGETRSTFANGITEIFIMEDNGYKGTRVFPDGKKEKGQFNERGEFYSGYRIGTDKQIEFYNPKSLVSCDSNSKNSSWEIYEVEEKLVVLENTDDDYIISDIPIHEVLIKASARAESKYSDGKSIGKILLHKDFENPFNQFIEFALGTNESGVPRLFGFSNAAILDILDAGSKIKAIDPLKIIDPVSKRNIFLQAANWGNTKLLNKLTALFPHALETIGQDVVAEFLLSGHSLIDMDKFRSIKTSLYCDFLEKAKLDAYHSMWLQVAKNVEPNENFKKEFALLSSEQQRSLYEAAFTYNNPFIHEPNDPAVRADQYSINLMWINESKIPTNQEFLFGKGSSTEEQQLDFQKRFIIPVAKWAKANPGSAINIWVDGKMATADAINRSYQALKKALEGALHGVVHFRDIRSMEIVNKNAEVFSKNMPVYFRVDLLRAIAADHVLRNKETKYFVYGDIDMKPLRGQQLFDKKTVTFLDDFGIVMAKGGPLGFENGFQILNGDNFQCINSHRKVIIDLSVEMALERPEAINQQQIYDTYPAMITHFLDADGRYGKFHFKKDEDLEEKLNMFRFDRFGASGHHILAFEKEKIKLRDIMPRKPVRLPPSHF